MTTLGEFLRNTRISKNITLGQVKKATHIREHVLNSIENDELEFFHTPAQLRGFVKHYAEFLGLDPVEVIREYLNQPTQPLPTQPAPMIAAALPAEAADQTEITTPPAPVEPAEPTGTESVPASDLPPVVPLHTAIFSTIAAALRERRLVLNLSMEEVEYYSHLRRRNVELLENADFDAFSSPVQVKGLLATYADFLELDRDQLLTDFAEGLLARRKATQANANPASAVATNGAGQPDGQPTNAPEPFRIPLWVRSLASVDLVFGFSVIIILLAIGLWGTVTIISSNNVRATENPSLSQALLEEAGTTTPIAEAQPTSAPVQEGLAPAAEAGTGTDLLSPTPLPTTENLMAVNVTLVVRNQLFLKVSVDGKPEYNARTNPGDVLVFHANRAIEVLTGNAGGISIVYNGQDLGPMGEQGQSALRIFDAAGAITPTPTISPTQTLTGVPTRTPIPTATPRASATPAQ